MKQQRRSKTAEEFKLRIATIIRATLDQIPGAKFRMKDSVDLCGKSRAQANWWLTIPARITSRYLFTSKRTVEGETNLLCQKKR